MWSLGIAFGGIAQFAAGMWEAKKNNTFGFTAFSAFGAFWVFLALVNIFTKTEAIAPVAAEGKSLFLVCWGIFAAYMTVCTFGISRALQVTFVLLTILFFGLAIGVHEPDGNFMHAVGWEGMLTAGAALYTSFAILLQETWGREVLPLGVVKPGPVWRSRSSRSELPRLRRRWRTLPRPASVRQPDGSVAGA